MGRWVPQLEVNTLPLDAPPIDTAKQYYRIIINTEAQTITTTVEAYDCDRKEMAKLFEPRTEPIAASVTVTPWGNGKADNIRIDVKDWVAPPDPVFNNHFAGSVEAGILHDVTMHYLRNLAQQYIVIRALIEDYAKRVDATVSGNNIVDWGTSLSEGGPIESGDTTALRMLVSMAQDILVAIEDKIITSLGINTKAKDNEDM